MSNKYVRDLRRKNKEEEEEDNNENNFLNKENGLQKNMEIEIQKYMYIYLNIAVG